MAGSQKQKGAPGKRRKPGDWIPVAQSRLRIARDLVNGRGVNNIPRIGEVGSAAYRRMKKVK